MTRVRLPTTLALALILAPALPAEEPPLLLRPAGASEWPRDDFAPSRPRPVEIDVDLLAGNPERLAFAWPDDGTFTAARIGFERRPGGGLFWRGHLPGGGEVLLTLHAGLVAGTLFTPDGTWSIEPHSGRPHLLRRIDGPGVRLCDGGLRPAPLAGTGRRERPPPEPRGAEPAVAPRIDVLVVYAAATLEAVGGRAAMEATLQSWVDIGNVAFAVSEIDARLRLVHAAPLPVEPAATATSRQLLRSLRRDPQIAALRDAHGADYVSLVYEGSRGACGRAFVMTDPGPGFEDSAFSVVERGCGTPITFIHELGHVLGSRHHPEEGGAGAFPYSYGHWSEREQRQTAMSSRVGCCIQQPYFSNPRVVIEGWRTGVANERDNARTFNQTARIVSEFRDSPCSLEPGHPDYCRECGPCAAGEGDCDGARECESDLACVKRAGRELGFSRKTDVCLPAAPADCPLPPGHPDYCAECGPCGRGEGDCDSNPECASGLTCVSDDGARFGLDPDVDVCQIRDEGAPGCALNRDPGDPFYCRICGPCQLGEGNCNEDMECAPFLTCVPGAGAEHGFGAEVAVCLFPEDAEPCPVPLGHRTYCRRCGPCSEGEASCKRDSHCRAGLVCVRGVGREFGFRRNAGVCLPPG